MKAITIWQPWASLIIIDAKPYEFRRWPAPRSIIGQRIVIHAAKRPMQTAELAELINEPERLRGSTGGDVVAFGKAMDLLESVWRAKTTLPLSVGLGTAILGAPRKALDLFASTMDPDDIDPETWGWPVSEIEPFEKPIPARGAQGFWEWRP